MIIMPRMEDEICKGVELCPADGADCLDNDPFKDSLVGSLFTAASVNRFHNI